MPRRVRPVSTERLAKLTTARLLAYRNRLLELEDDVEKADWTQSEVAAFDSALIYFKSDTRWRPLYDAVKTELSRREHVARR